MPQVVGPNELVAPGAAPPLDNADYVAYRARGNGIVVAPIVAHFSDGSSLACRPGGTAMLYPATPYTLWALRSWLSAIDGKPEHLLFPDWAVPMPKYLAVLGNQSILPSGECKTGNEVFRNVAPGKYYLVAVIQRTQSAPGTGGPIGGYEGHTEMTPAGLQAVYTPSGPYVPHWTYLDGYVMTANQPLEVRNGYITKVAPDAVHPAAHFLPAKR